MTNCFFAPFAKDRCQGVTDPCHIVRQQDITTQHRLGNPRVPTAWAEPNGLTGTKLKELLADERNIVAGCRHHHANADIGWLPYEIPASAREFAKQYGLESYLPYQQHAINCDLDEDCSC